LLKKGPAKEYGLSHYPPKPPHPQHTNPPAGGLCTCWKGTEVQCGSNPRLADVLKRQGGPNVCKEQERDSLSRSWEIILQREGGAGSRSAGRGKHVDYKEGG